MIERTMNSDRTDLARQMNVVTALGEAGLAPQVVITDSIVSFDAATDSLLARESLLYKPSWEAFLCRCIPTTSARVGLRQADKGSRCPS